MKHARAQVAGHQRTRFGVQGVPEAVAEPAHAHQRSHADGHRQHDKAELPGADFRSRQPMAAARFQLNARLAIFLLVWPIQSISAENARQRVLHDQAVLQHNLAVGAAGHFGVVRHQHQRRSRLAFRSSSRSRTSRPFAESRLPVGSSAMTMGGSTTKARASATRCCSPPESCTG